MRHNSTFFLPGKQSGSALVISLIILIIVMLMGVMAMTTSDTQFKMAGNLQFQDVAMNNAETAISYAEKWLSNTTNFTSGGFTTYDSATPNLFPISAAIDPLTMAWDDSNSVQITDPVTSLQNPNQRYLIQLMSTNNVLIGGSAGGGGRASAACDKVNTYLITARGASVRGAFKLVQSYYSVLINNGDPSQGCS
jgi:Tfp pilus assembly protein PilX